MAGSRSSPIPLGNALLGLAFAVAWLAAWRWLTLDTLLAHYDAIRGLVQARLPVALLLYVAAYAVVVGAGMPAASLMTLLGGAAFGWWIGGAATVLAATLGACGLFIAARGLLRGAVERRIAPWIGRLRGEFHADAASYLLLARLTPVFPFMVVTLAAASLGARFSTFAWTTLVGIVPGTLAYALVGSGLNRTLGEEAARLAVCRAAGAAHCAHRLDVSAFVTRDILWGLAALALVMLISLIIRRFSARSEPARD